MSALSRADARFLVVGGYAFGFHGRPRATKDLDIWVETSSANASKVVAALREFRAPLHGLTAEELATGKYGLRIGVEPNRIDIISKISGIEFADAWPNRERVSLGRLEFDVIGFDDLLRNKRAAGRAQDLADVAHLERISRLSKKPG